MKLLLLVSFISTILFAKEILLDDLLGEYEKSQSLYHKTKQESAGNLILFSRSDLDKMQAYTLNDVLKTIRMFNLEATRTGMTNLTKSGSNQSSFNSVKLFINSHELNSATLGDALTQYGKMSLYFIDHIEIYQMGNSVVFGNEPGSMVIKLYTKEPSRENATSMQTSIDTRGSLTLRAIDAREFDEYSYLANFDVSKNNYKTYNAHGYNLSRDGQRGQVYAKFSKKESFDIEFGATKERYDSFSGLGNAPLDGHTDATNIYLQATKHFDKDLNFIVSLSHENLEVINRDAIAIPTADMPQPKQVDVDIGSHIISAILEKRFIYKNNDLFVGAHIKHQKFEIDDYRRDGVSVDKNWGPTQRDIFMAYIENLYNINEDNLITVSAKLDRYVNKNATSSTEHILRLGYVALIEDSWTFKLFAMKSYVYPTFRQTTFSPYFNINPDLESIKNKIYSAELTYKHNKNTITVSAGEGRAKNAIVFNPMLKKYVNKDETGSFQRAYVRFTHNFDINNKITLEYFKVFQDKYLSSDQGGLIQLFNKVGKLDIYNELVYRSDYDSAFGVKMAAGYDYTLGITYPVNKKLDLKLKGENLLGKAHEVKINGVDVPLIERRGLLTMEYTF
ncbi:MAG: TonB-dependent receptor [Sulfurimonas sp.]|uniref:TonB-dependent receptor plug domain-containing protein n=1 Tax=Sulfurimonas sp. TaxID=2022749 RepID=UPI0025FC2DED|nr:TonB-dependent receptor [Sulfurimonas sp.]MCK9490843.1 TonB-dependent receptor [Sulfurimonas sp.]